jgi:DNA-binding beta-propeller fold protein YncE
MRPPTPRQATPALAIALIAALLLPATAASAGSSTFTGSIDADATNWRAHRFHVTATGTISATLDWPSAGTDLNLFLFDPDGTRVAAAATTNRPERISFTTTVTGTWRIGIRARTGATDYTLGLTYPTSDQVVGPSYVGTIGGGSAGHASMYPSGLDVDGAGNVYVADTGDDQIHRYGPGGALLWKVGTRGPKAPGRFENPRDVAFLAGKVYVADTGYNRVQVLNAADGSLASVWSHRFGTIMGISAGTDGAGNPVILVSESGAHTIRVFTPAGALIRSVGSGPGSGPGQLNGVRDAATDAQGRIYAADYANSRVVVFSPTGAPIAAWGTNGTKPGEFKRPYGIDIDDAGDVYVADSNNYIHRFRSGGAFVRAYGSPGTGPGQFRMLRRVAVGSGASPNVHGADLWMYKAIVFGHGGAHLHTMGGHGPSAGAFNEPYGIAADRRHVFVMDMVNQRVERFSAKRGFAFERSIGARGWGEGNPGLNWARGVAIGSRAGKKTVWVADTKNFRITEFWLNGTPTGRGFDPRGSEVGQLHWPFAVDTYRKDVVVANTMNNRVERRRPNGRLLWWVSSAGGKELAAPKALDVWRKRVYVADTLNNRVVVLSAVDGEVLRTFGGNVLHKVEGIAVEPNGDVWVADTSWDRLVEFGRRGKALQTVGSSGTGRRQFSKPTHLDIVDTGRRVRLYVVDSWNDRVQIYNVG